MLQRTVVLSALLFGAAAPAGCTAGAQFTTQQVTEIVGTRAYPEQTPDAAREAMHMAFASMGYEVVSDAEQLPIKTAPKLVQVNASGNANYASATGAEIAWTVDIEALDAGVEVRLTPRGYSNGQLQDHYNAAWIESATKTVFAEFESNLGDTES